jgi:hypothetical protein
MADTNQLQAYTDRWMRAAYAIQSAIAFLIERGGFDAATPKHLRVGIDTAKADHGALAELLIRKGVITEEEYLRSIAEGQEREARRYTAVARHETGYSNISFG